MCISLHNKIGSLNCKKMPSCIVIGAGIAGITAARYLQDAGWEVTVLDKGRGVGGRMATRRIENAVFDHGAQFFSAKDSNLITQTAELEKVKIAQLWHLEEMSLPDSVFKFPRWIGSKGMSSIPRQLSVGLDVKTNHKVDRIFFKNNRYSVRLEDETIFESDSLICTIPAPQAIDLLNISNFPLSAHDKTAFSGILYQPCIAVLAVLSEKTKIPHPGGIKFESNDISWIADNYQKGISEHFGVTIHASPEFSQKNLEGDLMKIGKEILDSMKDWVEPRSIETYQVHRWRYSLAEKRLSSKFVTIGKENPIYFGGDGFGIGNIEGAYQSGLAIAKELEMKRL
jgi:renalase